MSTLSTTRVKRWFKKSASEQYLYAKSLSPQQRDELEAELDKMMRSNTPAAGEAFTMWLSVQQARLRTHAPEQQEAYHSRQFRNFIIPYFTVVGTPLAVPMLLDTRARYYRAEARPEYARAFNNFLTVIGDTSLSHEIRSAASDRLNFHAFREGTISQVDTHRLRTFGAQHLAQAHSAGAFSAASGMGRAGPNAAYIGSVEDDLAAQTAPLGQQINRWMAAAGLPPLENASAFDHEEGATAFARLLDRRMDSAMQQPPAMSAKILQDGVAVIRAVTKQHPQVGNNEDAGADEDLQPLRPRVFTMASYALGSCVDNVSEGFSAIVATVANHEMAQDVKAGRISPAELEKWAGRQFRLGALEKEVHVFLDRATDDNVRQLLPLRDRLSTLIRTEPSTTEILNSILKPDPTLEELSHAQGSIRRTRRQADELLASPNVSAEGKEKIRDAIPLLDRTLTLLTSRKLLLHERVETMLHAKVKLRDVLDLPQATSASMMFETTSMLDEASLRAIADAVRASEADPNEMNTYLLSNTTWRAGMKQFHADRFKQLQAQFADDPFWEMIGTHGDEDVPDAVAIGNIESAAADLQKRMKTSEDKLLLECAGTSASGDPSAAVVGNLAAVKARFEQLHAGNWLTATDDEKYDAAILPALVMTENARTPALNLHLVSPTDGPTVGGTVNQLPLLARHRVMFSLPPEHRHYITADVRRSRGKTSVIAIEPLSPERGGYKDYWAKHYVPFLKSQFGDDVSVTVLTLDTQISGSDCRIYGLSHASKMADNAALFDALHRQNVSGVPLKTSLGEEAKQYVEDGNIRVVDGMGVLPSDFVKHAQSEETLDAWAHANPPAYSDATVNKAGQTLTERYEANATTRFRFPQRVLHARMQGENPEVKSTKTSTSIELKRLTYIDRAMAYFSQAPAKLSAQVLADMQGIDRTSSDMQQPWAGWRRNWGPNPGM